MEFGEKNNAYFLGLEKKRQIKKSITKLLDVEGNIITKQRDILDKIKYSYKSCIHQQTQINRTQMSIYIEQT